MKTREVIDAATSDWHVVDASQMAADTFDQLDVDEIDRLARRAYTEEWRAALRSKDADGVPRYASIEHAQPDGSMVRVYKQTALFSVADYDAAISYHMAEAASHVRTAKGLAKRCKAIHGTDVPIPGLDSFGRGAA